MRICSKDLSEFFCPEVHFWNNIFKAQFCVQVLGREIVFPHFDGDFAVFPFPGN